MDSKDTELKSTAVTKEKAGPKVVRMRSEFAYFDNPIPSGDDEIMEVADIENSGNLIGSLIGKAKTGSGRPVSGIEPLHLTFEIEAKVEEPHIETERNITPFSNDRRYEGFPFEKPVIIATVPIGNGQKTYASVGLAENTNIRNITFTHWQEVQDQNKSQIVQKSRGFEPQPMSLKLHQLLEAKFKIT